MRWLLFVFLALVSLACQPKNEGFPVPTATPGVVEADTQRAGDPAAGYSALVNESYIACGLPYSAYEKVGETDPGAPRLPGRTGLNADMPYYLTVSTTPSGVDVVGYNCLACHASTFNGEFIIGLGNSTFDGTQDTGELAELLGVLVEGEAERTEWRRWADRLIAIAPYTTAHTVGVNTANNSSAALMTFRDPETMEWSDTPVIAEPPRYVIPAKVPPWWRMQKKHGLYHMGNGRGDHVGHIMLASLLCAETVEQLEQIDTYFGDILAYLTSIEPPSYPFEIDQTLADQGREVFEETCARCHGTYGEGGVYPNLTVGLEEVRTDPLMADTGVHAIDHYEWFSSSFYGANSYQLPVHGYYAPPLDAVWATAPYLHNGSVPDIATLLNSPARPTYWTRTGDFDAQTVGVPYAETHSKADENDHDVATQIYDTTMPGYANTGHTFGDALTETNRAAIIEYLKTL